MIGTVCVLACLLTYLAGFYTAYKLLDNSNAGVCKRFKKPTNEENT